MERRYRLILLGFAVLLCAQLLRQGHGTSRTSKPMAFLRYSANAVAVRLKGRVTAAGIYLFPEGTSLGTVMEMTERGTFNPSSVVTSLERKVVNGDVVHVKGKDGQPAEIALSRMRAREMMLLGIRLKPDEMTVSDWDDLPGIGPELASVIINDRQTNGSFGSVHALLRVPGIGEKKLERLLPYF